MAYPNRAARGRRPHRRRQHRRSTSCTRPGHRPEHCCLASATCTRADEPWLRADRRLAVRRRHRAPRPGGRRRGGRGGAVPLAARAAADAARRRRGLPRPRRGLAVRPRDVGQDLHHARLRAALQPDARRRWPSATSSAEANADLAPKPPTMARIVEINRGPLLTAAPRARCVERHRRRRPAARRARAGGVRRRARAGLAQRARRAEGLREPRRLRRSTPTRPIVIVADGGSQAAEAARLLAARRASATWPSSPAGCQRERELARFAPLSLDELVAGAMDGTLQVVDVREPDEQDYLVAGRARRSRTASCGTPTCGARPVASRGHGVPDRRPGGDRGVAARAARLPQRPAGASTAGWASGRRSRPMAECRPRGESRIRSRVAGYGPAPDGKESAHGSAGRRTGHRRHARAA